MLIVYSNLSLGENIDHHPTEKFYIGYTTCAFGSTFDRIDSKRIDYDRIDSDIIDFERIDLCLDTIM